MTRRFHRGLVVGKFSPLHRGHQLVIDRAIAECEEVVLLSYSEPEFPGCEADARARWLEALYPEARRLVLSNEILRAQGAGHLKVPPNDASSEDQRAFVARVCQDLLGAPVDAVFTSEDYGEGFSQALTTAFQQWRSDAAPVAHVLVDQQRQRAPVSGTLIRDDVHRHRSWLAPEVYASFVERVCLLGGESSGKTTLAAALAESFATLWVPEYGRQLWDERGGQLSFEDTLLIARRQVAEEERATLAANHWLFCDTSPLTTSFYSQELFGRVHPELQALAGRRYHVTLLCAPDFPFVQDGTRREATFRDRQHRWYLDELARSGTGYVLIGGTLSQRIDQVTRLLSRP